MKKVLSALVASIVLCSAIPVMAAEVYNLTPVEYPVLVNEAEYTDKEQPLLNYEGRTYVPLAKIADILGVNYLWNSEKSRVEISTVQSSEPAPSQSTATATAPGHDFDVAALKAAEGASKLIVTLGNGDHTATTYAFEKVNGSWSQKYAMAGFVGRNGISSSKKEGDGETPAGVYSLSQPFGVADDPGSLIPYTKLTSNDFWVDDVNSKYYNKWAYGDVSDKDWDSAEDLSTETVAYKYAIVIDYNTDPIVKGDGSAIFLHCSTDRATAGCVSVSEEDMVKLLKFIDDDTKIVIAQAVRDLPKY